MVKELIILFVWLAEALYNYYAVSQLPGDARY